MTRAWASRAGAGLQVLCGVLMALGAFGHSLASGPPIQSALAVSNLNHDLQHLLTVVWHFGGVCMLLLGGLVAFAARQLGLQPAAVATSLVYVAFGLLAWAWAGMPFFAIFTALGLGVLGAIRLTCGPSRSGPHDSNGVGA